MIRCQERSALPHRSVFARLQLCRLGRARLTISIVVEQTREGWGANNMKRSGVFIATLAALAFSAAAASAQTKPGIDKLYILSCGEGVSGDISRWSPGVNVGKSMDFADNCYLIHHTQGWLLWDTGIADAIAE